VTAGVRISIQDNEISLSPMNDQRFLIVACGGNAAEDAFGGAARALDEVLAPGAPDVVHVLWRGGHSDGNFLPSRTPTLKSNQLQ
jgi:hypothetical protein